MIDVNWPPGTQPAASAGWAYGATVEVGPPATREQEQAIREQDAADAEAAVAHIEAKLANDPSRRALRERLDEARAEARRLRLRAEKGDG